MKSLSAEFLFLGIALVLVGCSADRAVDPPLATSADNLNAGTIATELVAREVVELYNWEMDDEFVQPDKAHPGETESQWLVLDSEFEEVSADIYHYSWRIQTGTGPFDIIRLHRVVEVGMRSQPIRARKSVFMLHGDFKDFPGCFLPGLSSPIYSNDFGIAVYFAQQGVDVWGMDQAHNSIPADATDLSSMADFVSVNNSRE